MLAHSFEEVVRHIRRGADTRSKLLEELEWSRTTLTSRLDELTHAGIIRPGQSAPSTGGRPATKLELNPDHGLILALDIGGSHSRLAVCSADASVVRVIDLEAGRTAGHDLVADWIRSSVTEAEAERILAVGAGIPIPPPQFGQDEIAPPGLDWEGFSPARILGLDVPEVFTRDVAVVARGEAQHPDVASEALIVKIGLGLSVATLSEHRVLEGANGAAGAFLLPNGEEFVAAETLFSGYTVRNALVRHGLPHDAPSSDLVTLAADGSALGKAAHAALNDMAGRLGAALTALIAFVDPQEVLIGGNLAESDIVVDGIRTALMERMRAPQRESIRVQRCRRGREAGVIGAANLALDALTTQEALAARIQNHRGETA